MIGEFVPLRRTFCGVDYGERTVSMRPSIGLEEVRTVAGDEFLCFRGDGQNAPADEPCFCATLGG